MLRFLASAVLILSTVLGFAKDKDKDSFQRPGPIRLDKDGKKWVDKTLRKMSTEEKVGQLFNIWTRVQFFNEADPTWIALRDSVRKYHVGGVTMSVYVVVDNADAHFVRARAAGAEITRELETQDYGGRDYTCKDPEGNVWTFGTYDPMAH